MEAVQEILCSHGIPWTVSGLRINSCCWLASGAEERPISRMNGEWKQVNPGCWFSACWAISIDFTRSTTLEEEAFASLIDFDEG